MFTLMIIFSLAGQPQTQLNLYSMSQESCRIDSLATETIFRNMGVTEYSTRCVKNPYED